MDMDRDLREMRARQIKAAMKAAAPRLRKDFWEMKRAQEREAGENWR